MRNMLAIIGVLALGICIGAIVPHMFVSHVDTSWRPLLTESENFGIVYDSSAVLSDLPMPEIPSVVGRAKFIDNVGQGQTTELGYIINIKVAALDLSKVPQRYKEKKKTIVDGYETTTSPIEKTYYEIKFDFDLKDKDGFTLKTVHADGLPSLVSGTNNVFQAKVGEPIAYELAIKVHDILVRPLIDRCFTCLPPTQTTGTKPPAECAAAKDAAECADTLKKLGKNPFDAYGNVGSEPVYGGQP